jgi:hypothetical protein
MFKKINFDSLRQDLRKIGVTFVIGGLTGLYLRHFTAFMPFASLAVTGCVIWYFGLKDGGNNNA